MANPSTANEPSMEEILASIRQIISEDGDSATAAARGESRSEAKGVVKPAPDFDRDEEAPAFAPGTDTAQSRRGQAYGEVMTPQSENLASVHPATSASEEPGPRGQFQARGSLAPQRGQPAEDRHLLSEDSDSAVAGAFSALAHTILAQNARTLEDLVTEMLKPMLKGWLDDNLPLLVERLVKEEIERVSRGRR